MSRQTSPEVDVTLRSWADANAPTPSPVLALFIGPVHPLPAPGRSAAPAYLRGLARVSLGTKVFVGVTSLAIAGAAAVGVAHVAGTDADRPRPPAPSAAAVPGIDDSRAPTTGSSNLGSPSASELANPTEEPTEPALTPTPSARPRDHSTSSDDPGAQDHPTSRSPSADDGSDDGDTPSTEPPDPDTRNHSSEPTAGSDSGSTPQSAPPEVPSTPQPLPTEG